MRRGMRMVGELTGSEWGSQATVRRAKAAQVRGRTEDQVGN